MLNCAILCGGSRPALTGYGTDPKISCSDRGRALHPPPVAPLAVARRHDVAVQPDEGVSVSLGAKIPGARMRIRPVNMEFHYGTSFVSQSPEAYERLILDAMRGDATLFTRNDEIEALWGIIDPILTAWHDDPTSRSRISSRNRGPAEADELMDGAGRAWRRLPMSEDFWSAQTRRRTRSTPRSATCCTSPTPPTTTLVPARVLNLVVIVDRDWKGEIANRLERVGRYHASRTVLCAVEDGTRDARRSRRDVLRGSLGGGGSG